LCRLHSRCSGRILSGRAYPCREQKRRVNDPALKGGACRCPKERPCGRCCRQRWCRPAQRSHTRYTERRLDWDGSAYRPIHSGEMFARYCADPPRPRGPLRERRFVPDELPQLRERPTMLATPLRLFNRDPDADAPVKSSRAIPRRGSWAVVTNCLAMR